MLQALIVDDSARSRELVRKKLEKLCPQVHILGEAESGDDAFSKISRLRPNLILLDIQMPNGGGFDLLRRYPDFDFEVIFITAFDQYTLEAIRFSAVDYLLKPIDQDELVAAIDRAENRIRNREANDHYKYLMDNLLSSNQTSLKLAIPTIEGYEFIPLDKLIRFEGEGAYTRIYLLEGKVILSTQRLKALEEILQEKPFFRIHKSHLVNLSHVNRYKRGGNGGYVYMEDGAELRVSREKKDDFLRALKAI